MSIKYKNEEWLRKKYIDEELHAKEIGEICGVKHPTIIHYLKKYNINCRSLSEAVHLRNANHCKFTKEAIEWINGELLGDGSLSSRSIYSANFRYSSKYLEYIRYVSNILKSFGINQAGRIIKIKNKEYKNYSYCYCSRSYVELLPIYKQWYPKGIKIIPRDIKLSKLTLRQHFIGDGCLRREKYGKPRIILATYGFTISDIKWLIKQLSELGFKAMRWACRNAIAISVYSTKDFLNYIGKCPVKCYQYKFEYCRRKLNDS